MVRQPLTLLTIATLIIACSHGSGSNAPPTPEERCRGTCTPIAGHPCGLPDATECESTCLSHIDGRSDDCTSCILLKSGWNGTTCKCDGALGTFGNLTCTECGYHGNTKGCSSGVMSCNGAASLCTGYKIYDATDIECASRCGVAPVADAGAMTD